MTIRLQVPLSLEDAQAFAWAFEAVVLLMAHSSRSIISPGRYGHWRGMAEQLLRGNAVDLEPEDADMMRRGREAMAPVR